MGASQNYNVNLNINANTQSAQQQLQNLQKQLMQIANMKVNVQGADALASNITEASQAALKLSSILSASTNMQTGNLDYIKFSNALKKGNIDIVKYGQSLQELGPAGQKAFVGLAQTIAKSEIPIKRTSQLTQKMWDGFKRTAGWQLQSSIIHGVVGGVQKAVGYAKDLNKSLTDIRIVTGQSSDQMAKFAQQANNAAKQLNTTTTEYTKASLIYYQQGLSDAEVKARTETTIKMANVTGTSAQKVSDQMTAIWNNYDNGTKSLTHYADVMTALGAATASSTDEIAEGLQKFASISDTVGLSYEYAASALATITSTSRESADVVGNSLKTLFSRIQGLQLGETLDDGTTLNKYSTALAKVGISIKDSSGGLKDMDNILDEMGTKWQTLANDEKMALAQTVAGVRQYTQLMTLMENWDDFKKNLNIANTSTGTLDSQAAIYAESWDAASKKVRTSFEGLWDKLINSDSFITALDLLSGFVDVLSSLVDGMGGATGVFTSFAGALTKVFSPQIAQGLSNFGYGIKMMMPGVRKAYEEKREQELETFKTSLKSGHMEGVGTEESNTYSSIVDRQIAGAKQYLRVQNQLSPEQRYAYEHYSKLLDENDAQRLENSQQRDQNAQNIGNIFDRIYSGNRESKINDPNYGLNARYRSIGSNGEIVDSGKTRRDYFIEKANIQGSRLDAARQLTSLTGDEFNKFLGQFSAESQTNIQQRIAAWKDNEELTEDAILRRLPGYVAEINDKSMKRASSSMVLTEDEQKDIPDSEGQQQYRQHYEDYGKEKSKSEPLKQQGERLKQKGQQIFEEREKVAQPEKKLSTAQKMVSLASGLTSAVATISSLEGLGNQIKALGDGAGDATAVLGSLVSVTSNGLMAFSSLSHVMGGPYAAALMAAMTLITMVSKAIDKNNISEKERINTLKQSDAELDNATTANKNLIETYKTQNENYNESIEKIKINMANPDQLANDIFYANKQAMELVSEYGLKENQYSKNSMGLIEIDQKVLDNQVEVMEKANMDLQRTSALSGATTQQELAEIGIENLLKKSYFRVDTNADLHSNQLDQKTVFGNERNEDGTIDYENRWTFDEMMSIYGTKAWDEAKNLAKNQGYEKMFKDMEEQILQYQEANNLLNLAARNNVDYLLKSQEYTLDGAETFAALAYEDYKKKYDEEYESGKFSKDNLSSLNEEQKNQIKKYLESQGYTEIENINFDGSDASKFTFDHSEGKGSVNVEAVRKWDAEQLAADKTQEVFDASFDVLQHLTNKNAETAPGLMSLLTGDNFVNTTIGEMEKAQSAVQTMREEILEWDEDNKQYQLKDGFTGSDADMNKFIKENFGIDTKTFKDLFNIGDSVDLIDWFKTFENYTSKAQRLISGEPLLDQWLIGEDKEHDGFGNKIKENLNQGTLISLYDSFKQTSLLGGTDAGQAMINGITEVLKKSNLDESDWDQAVQGLLAIDWSNTLTSGGAAASIISNLGGELNTTTAAWEAFAEAMAAAAGAMPDFSESISQLTQLASALQGLSKGGTVSADIRDQLVNMNAEFANLFSKHYSGDYTFIGEDSKILRDAIWDKMGDTKTQADEAKKKYDDYIKNHQERMDNDDITMDDFILATSTNNKGSRRETIGHASNLGVIAGYSVEAQANILDNYTSAKNNLGAWGSETGRILSDGRIVKRDTDGKFQVIENGVARDVTDYFEIYDFEQEYQADQAKYSAAKGAQDTMLDKIHGLDEISGEWKPEEIEQRISAASSLSEVLGRIQDKQEGLVDSNGDLTESTKKGIEAWTAQNDVSESTQAAMDAAIVANQTLQELRNNPDATSTEIKTAETARDNALAYAELQVAIDEVAAAEGLSNDLIAAKLEYLQQESDLSGMTAKQQAELATSYVKVDQGLDELKKNYQNLAKILDNCNEGSNEWNEAMISIKKSLSKISGININKISTSFVKAAKSSGLLEKAINGDQKALFKLTTQMGIYHAIMEKVTDAGDEQALAEAYETNGMDGMINKLKEINGLTDEFSSAADTWNETIKKFEAFTPDQLFNNQEFQSAAAQWVQTLGNAMNMATNTLSGLGDAAQAAGFEMVSEPIGTQDLETINNDGKGAIVWVETGPHGAGYLTGSTDIDSQAVSQGQMQLYRVRFKPLSGGSGGPGGGGGGGGGGPKKVANKRKSQTVKRYKRNDAKRDTVQRAKKSEENKKDYLYGESKIAQMEKINKLAEKEAKITADRIKESQKYLVEDRQNLIKYMQKYGFEAEFDSDGFLANYEEAWTKLYEELAKLYEDNELTKEEEELEEEINIKLEELEGALEDYENTLAELANDIEAYEETLYEMFDNKIEQMQHKVEYKLELDEDSLTYIDFLIENLGDSAVRAIDKIGLISQKTDYLFNSIETAYEGVKEIYDLSDDPLHLFATGGADIEGLLTESQVEALREQASSLQEFADQLREIRDTIQEQVTEVFDMWTEKIDHNLSALEHYGSVMDYFKNIIDLTGNDIFGLSNDFIRNMESAQIDQSIDQMKANKDYYEDLQSMRASVENELQKAQASGDEERIAYWEEHLRTLDEEMQSAQDSMLSALESTLSMISDQFTAAMEAAVEQFNESIYASGGLEGLSADYSLLREEADLMAEDYDKIYQLSKITRNINKTLDDTKIIAGKQRLNALLSEINDLQASGVEMSKYDLEYLEAKYQLYLAQIELENSRGNKDTVQLQRDSEGNWSYIYTTNEEKVDEAQQKYEDALYEMQNKNHEYLEEMSGSVIELTQQMNEEIAGLEISDFANLEEYNKKVEEIQQKYLAQIERRENELDKAITNNQDLYEKDWKAYSKMTDYKISADENWIDSFKETTLGYLTQSESVFSDFGTRITSYAATLAEQLSGAAGSYFSQIEETLKAYDTSIAGFGAHITGTYNDIQSESDETAKKTTDMATKMKEAFETVVTTVGEWQETDGLEITEMLSKIAEYLEGIFAAINKSANIKTDSGGETIGQQEAVRMLKEGFEYNGETYSFGEWKFNKRGDLDIDDGNGYKQKGSNLVAYHAHLLTEVQEALDAYYSNPKDEMLKAAAEALIKKYWAYRSVIDRVYDPGEIEKADVPTKLDTGGYTGEWGHEGKLAILHEKELILNPNDTSNFLEALNISRQLIEMIEMNARASSLGLGEMVASTIKDTSQTIEQQVSITAEFPNATDHSEIEEAFDNLINMASQYAYRSE